MVQIRKVEVEQAIVSAARDLFMQHGYAGTRIPQVAKAAGVSPANIYVYFGSKLELLNRVYEQWFAERLDELRNELEQCRTHEDKLRKLVMAIWRDLPAADNGFCNSLIEALSAPGNKEKYSSSLRVTVEQGLVSMLSVCLPALAHQQHHAAAKFLLMAFDGYALNYHLNSGETASEEDVAFLCGLLLR
ncbi:TetR family transcriptional regulator [Pusillimonas noertemannii]|uniref:TetR family transcriptional regulator n=1 Tax=Pusillimonas noertemannii TaxID=305977 RepID=A0A2U1CNK9_9BURK|nr:TetR family transcriptional regulator [Pusillimonas noertemannii]